MDTPWGAKGGTTIMKRQEREIRDPDAKMLLRLDSLLANVEKEGFLPLDDFSDLPDGAAVRRDSELWLGRFLADQASPYQLGMKVRRSIHRAVGALPDGSPDVLRHEFQVPLAHADASSPTPLDVMVTETVGFLRIDARRPGFDLLQLPELERPAAIAAIAESVLRLRGSHQGRDGDEVAHQWVFLHGPLAEGARFSTAPGESSMIMWSWADRVDGGIQNGNVYFIGMKHYPATGGTDIMRDDTHWFDGECWEPLRNPRRSFGHQGSD
jgi:hypothetical protein